MENQLAGACGRIDVLLQALKTNALCLKSRDRADQMSKRPCQPIQAPHNEHIPASEMTRPLEAQAQDCLIHYSGQEKDLLDLLRLRDPSELVTESHRDLGFEEPFLLFGFGWGLSGSNGHLDPYRIKTHRRSQVL